MATERLQKVLAKAGIASRRKAEELITLGEVTINGKVAKIGDKAELGVDAIKVGGKLLQRAENKVYLAFHKPRGVISMLVDTENRPNLSDFLSKVRERVFPIGRLDFTSEGLILLTNDGDFAEKLQRRDDIPRVYTVKVRGHLEEEKISRIRRGARIENRLVRPHSVRVLRELDSKSQVEIVMLGSGAVDIRAMMEFKGFLVEKITRTSIGHLTLKGLPAGHYRLLKEAQIMQLLEKPELGLQRLEREIEDSLPQGQRNRHEKKEGSEELEASSESDSASSKEEAVVKTRIPGTANMVIRRRAGAAPAKSPITPRAAGAPEREKRPFSPRGPRRDAGDSRPSFGSDRPKRPFSSDDRGEKRPFSPRGPRRDAGDSRPSFGGDRDKRPFSPRGPRAGGDSRPSFGGDRDKRPFSPRGPRSNAGPGMSFGGDRPKRPFASKGPRPSSSDSRPSFGSDRPKRPFAGKSAGPRPGNGPVGGGFGGGDRPSRPSSRPPRPGSRPSSGGAGFKPRRK